MKYQQETILEMSKEGGIQSGIFNEVDMQRRPEIIPLENIKDESARAFEARRRELKEKAIERDFKINI